MWRSDERLKVIALYFIYHASYHARKATINVFYSFFLYLKRISCSKGAVCSVGITNIFRHALLFGVKLRLYYSLIAIIFIIAYWCGGRLQKRL